MKNAALIVLAILTLFGSAYGAHSTGWINETYSYKKLKFWRKDANKCFMQVTLVNTSGKKRNNISVVIQGKDIFNKISWEVKKKIKTIEPYKGEIKIETRLNRYDGNEFYDVDPCDAYKIDWIIEESG